MRIQIVSIAERGVANRERLHLRALAEVELNRFAVLANRYLSPASLATGGLLAFWFPPVVVKPGDSVILFSGSGAYSTSRAPDGTTNHFFYWGLQRTVWNRTGDCAVLVELESWAASVYE